MINKISNIRLIIISTLIIICFLCCFYENASGSDLGTLVQRLNYQTLIYPQEKIYVATDKNVYVAGDTIRFRAFLVDAAKLTQIKDGSKYVYVDVINPFGESLKRIKVKENDGVFAGIVPLPEEMPEGTYTLGAYTLFMKNQGDGFIFRKPVPILSQLAKKYKLNAEFDGNNLKTALIDQISDKASRAINVSLYSKNGIIRDNVSHRSDFTFSLNPQTMKEDVLKVKYDHYEKFVRVPKDTASFIVTFHPEGGDMVSGVINKIAFKALGNDGLSKEVKGSVLNSRGEKICDFESVHKGMGTFSLTPNDSEAYRAIINGKTFHLPPIKNNATALSIDNTDSDSIAIKINGMHTPDDVLIADNCGIITYVTRPERRDLRIGRKGLGSGLIQFYLIDKNNNIKSSRLIFNRNGYVYADSITSVPDGDYAITSRIEIQGSVSTKSIVSELMLQGNLKGYIEDPDYYFRDVDSIKDRNLDNLMLTQGWKRYDIQKAVKGNFEEPKEPMEIGGELSGTVYSRWKGKPLKGAIVNVLAPEINYAGIAETDSLGRYTLNGLDWPDGTFFIVQAFNKNGNKEHNLIVDKDVEFSFENIPENYSDININDSKLFDNGAVWLQELEVKAPRTDEEVLQDMYKALGVRTVTSDDMEKDNLTSYEEVIRKIPGLNIQNGNLVNMGARGVLRGDGLVELWVDGIKWNPSSGEMKRSSGSDSRLLGGMPTPNQSSGEMKRSSRSNSRLLGGMPKPDQSYVDRTFNTFLQFSEAYPINIIESFQYFRSSIAMVISLSAAQGAGALVMKTKDGSKLASWDHNLFLKRALPIGYQKEAEAYEPHFTYDPTSETPTPNSYWYPKVKDIENIPEVANSITVVEGITINGFPFYGIIRSKENNTNQN